MIVVLIFASMIAWALSAVGDWLLNNVQRFQALYMQATDWLEEHGIFVAGVLAERFDVMWLLRLFQDIARRLNQLAGFAILVFVFLMMALLEVEQFRRKLASLKDGGRLSHAISGIAAKFRRYMLVRTLLSLLTGLAIWGLPRSPALSPRSHGACLPSRSTTSPSSAPSSPPFFPLSSPSRSSTPGRPSSSSLSV